MKNYLFGLFALCMLHIWACESPMSLSDNGAVVALTVVDDPSLPSIMINGRQLHAETFGDPTDPILLVLHGGPGADYRSMLNFADFSNDSFFVVFYDQLGSGLSERLDEEAYTSVQIFIDELDAVIDHYQSSPEQKIILAGHSWGAMLATAYINQQPDKIDGAILMEPGGFTWEQTEAYFSRSRTLNLFNEQTNDFVYQDQFISGSDHNTLDYKLALSIAGDVATGDVAPPAFWRYGSVCNTSSINLAMEQPELMDFTAKLSAFPTKVLFAYSELNPAYGVEHAELLSAAYSNVELVEVPGCGHEIPQYGWNPFYSIAKNYLDEIL